MRWLAAPLAALCSLAGAQEADGTRELVGTIGGRTALMLLQAAPRADRSWRVTGEYVILPQMRRRYVEGERSAQLGVLFLKEGTSPILWSRPATATLQGTWNGGRLRGTRFGPGGQERERFELHEDFPEMHAYSATVRCEAAQERYRAALAFTAEDGRLKAGTFKWTAALAPDGPRCALGGLSQQPSKGGLALAAGRCTVQLRRLGEFVRVTARDCAEFCGPGASLEPMMIDRRGGCQLLRPR